MRNHFLKIAITITGLATACSSYAAGDPVAGQSKAQTCVGCHGVPGYRNAVPVYNVPKIYGQHADYIVAALKEYQAGRRAHPTMQAQARTMSDADMQDLAAYFASGPKGAGH